VSERALAGALESLERVRRAQRLILQATASLYPLHEPAAFQASVVRALLGLVEVLTADVGQAQIQALLLRVDEGEIWACSDAHGPMARGPLSEVLPPETCAQIEASVQSRQPLWAPTTVLPLLVGEHLQGVIYLNLTVAPDGRQSLQLFGNQLALMMRNAQLFEMAAFDPLTGVHARGFFDQWLVREVMGAFRARHPISLLMIDLDGMKKVNDVAGHLRGDEALAKVGRILTNATREHDIVGRYGGDEFALILPRETGAGAAEVASRILQEVGVAQVAGPSGPIPLCCSVGAATLDAEGFELKSGGPALAVSYFSSLAQRLVAVADGALYVVKHAGGNGLHQADTLTWPRPEQQPAK
jgi:diguanylate cyclase (GGDEF)-like protein